MDEVEALRLRVAALEAENAALRKRGAPVDVYAAVDALKRNMYDGLDRSNTFLDTHYDGAKKRQMFAVGLLMCWYPISLLFAAYAAYRIFVGRSAVGAVAALCYASWVWYDESPRRCGRSVHFVRFGTFAKWLGDYFPLVCKKADPATEFSPKDVYLFGYHPHGIISVGCFTQFAFDGSGASKLFPGLRFHCATLNFNFRVPLFRELLLALGVIEVSARSIKNALASGPGAAVVIVPGGAAESLDASPGTEHVLTLRKRNGFFRIALQHGVKLVPVFSFGENALYDAVTPTGIVKRTQVSFLKFFGFAVPVYLGAGSNSAVVGSPIPHRRPVYTVVGDPIACPTIEHPTQTEIDDLKRVYIERLEAVFQRFAADCGAKEHRLKIEK